MAKPTWDVEKIETFEKLVQGAVEYANKHNLSLSVVEASMRDILANVEAHRMLNAMRARGAKL